MKKQKKQYKGGKPLTLRERSIIEVRYCQDFKTISGIAKEIDRNKSSISREINGKPRGKYNADIAHHKALKRIKNRGNKSKIEKNPLLKEYIETKIKIIGYSPEQISLRLSHEYKDDKDMRISCEAIYQDI